jgi:hypothetical protein
MPSLAAVACAHPPDFRNGSRAEMLASSRYGPVFLRQPNSYFIRAEVRSRADSRSAAKDACSSATKVNVFRCLQGAEFGDAEIVSERVRPDRDPLLVVQGQLLRRLTDEA